MGLLRRLHPQHLFLFFCMIIKKNKVYAMATVPVPSLSEKGWVVDMKTRVDILLSDFFISQYSQSYLYYGKVRSLTYLIAVNQHNPPQLASQTQSNLEQYFGYYFPDAVSVEVWVVEPNDPTDDRLNLQVEILVSENGKKYSVAKLIEDINSKSRKIADINNYGA